MMFSLRPLQGLDDAFAFARILVRAGFPVRTAKRVVDDLTATRRAFAWTPIGYDSGLIKPEARRHGVEIRYPKLRNVDVKALRAALGVSQEAFAGYFCLDLSTVQNWEQGRTKPDGPAVALLHLIDKEPDRIIELLSSP